MKRNKNLYCRFNKDTGHDTDVCRKLEGEIELLIWRGNSTSSPRIVKLMSGILCHFSAIFQLDFGICTQPFILV